MNPSAVSLSSKRLAVIGAGPIGIEAALRGAARGWSVTVFERDTVGAHLLKWGHVRFFSALKDNVSPFMLNSLSNKPDLSSYLLGREFVELVLKPAAQSAALSGRIREGCHVRAIAKRRMMKNEMPGHPLREERPFQILVHSKSAGEEIVEADVVLDAGGVYGTANWSGESGLPCPGEREASLDISRHMPDILGRDRSSWLGQEILLIGDGHSAATAMAWFYEISKDNASTHVHWVVATDRSRPCVEVADDPLPERKRTVQIANNLAETPPPGWRVYRKSALLRLENKRPNQYQAWVGRGDKYERISVQKILSLTGYRPDHSYSEELQVHVSPVTSGAGGLAKSLMDIKDCLSPVVVPPQNLRSGEAGYFMIGHKSYGRLNTFLLRSGLQQLDTIFELAGK